jgi:Spy/CpxP family protein refolding chaperone
MRPTLLGPALVIVFLTLPASQAPAQSGFPWWKDPKVVQELGLTPDQSARIDSVFRAAVPHLQQSKTELDRQEAELSRLVETNADEATVLRQVDKVEVVRGSLNKSRTLMLLHMRQVFTPKQNTKFKAVFEQYRRENPRPAGPPPESRAAPDAKGSEAKGRPQPGK